MITNKDEAKAITEDISSDCKCKFSSATCNSKQKCNNKTCQCECENYRKCKENYSWNRSTCIFENSKYLKSIADTSVTKCHKIVIVMNDLLPKKANTRAKNATNTASINCHSKEVSKRLLYFTYSFISDHVILVITIICYHYTKRKGKIQNGK